MLQSLNWQHWTLINSPKLLFAEMFLLILNKRVFRINQNLIILRPMTMQNIADHLSIQFTCQVVNLVLVIRVLQRSNLVSDRLQIVVVLSAL